VCQNPDPIAPSQKEKLCPPGNRPVEKENRLSSMRFLTTFIAQRGLTPRVGTNNSKPAALEKVYVIS
jgi:hypothetical protein